MARYWSRKNDKDDETDVVQPWAQAVSGGLTQQPEPKPLRILFVCHGNICRSPMAERVMKHLVHEAGRDAEFEIASAATSTEEIGNPMYPPARRKLAEHGISGEGHSARQITKGDYAHFDFIIGMDQRNMRNMLLCFGADPEGKLHLLLDFTQRPGDVADPWYTGNFDATWRDCFEGCTALLSKVMCSSGCDKI